MQQRNPSPSLFKQLSNLLWPAIEDRITAKEYLCNKQKLSAAQADQELEGLMDMEANLLCNFYAQGLRGSDIRALKDEYHREQKSFLKLNTDLLYPTGSLDPYFHRILTNFMNHNIAPQEALRLLLNVAEQKPEHVKDRIAYLATHHQMSTQDAFKMLGNFSENGALTFMYLVQDTHYEPVDARALLANKSEAEIVEIRMIESPSMRK